MSNNTAHVTVTLNVNEFILAFKEMKEAIQANRKALEMLRKRSRLLHRDWIRATRQPALIHNGRKPR